MNSELARRSLILLCAAVLALARVASGATYNVISPANSGAGTLRTAIENANANPGKDTIEFYLPPASRTIDVTTELPRIADRAVIDGTTQSGYSNAPLVTLNAASSAVTNGLFLGAGGSSVTAVRVHGFTAGIMVTSAACAIQYCYFMSNTAAGVYIKAGGNRILDSYFATNDIGVWLAIGNTNTVQGNFIGVHPLTGAVNGNRNGIYIATDRNFIGGTGTNDGNVISGNLSRGIEISWTSSSNLIRGNLIGTDAAGTVAVPNDSGILIAGNDNDVGGTKAGSRNVISGNDSYGIILSGGAMPIERNAIEGNYIGTDITGSNALPNGTGIYLHDSVCRSNTIGSAVTAARNIISGNTDEGIKMGEAPYNVIKGNYIGTDASGRFDLGNGGHGVFVDRAWETVVGGTTAGDGNIISGNGEHGLFFFGSTCDGSTVEGNRIGTTAAGGQALANGWSGIMLSGTEDVTVGGIGVGFGNVISGNSEYGIYISSANAHDVVVQGNWVGTTASGQGALGNGEAGIYVIDSPSNLIGGVAASAGNVVSGNGGSGIIITGAGAVSNVIQSNRIGVDEDGEDPLPNLNSGLVLDGVRNCRVGGDLLVGGGNVISGNRSRGIWLLNASSCVLVGNRIGGHTVGAGFGGNTNDGIYLTGTSSSNTIGGDVWSEVNIVAYNGRAGINVAQSNCVGNRIDYNWIFNNGGLGIDLGDDGHTPNDTFISGDPDDGPNNLQNYPGITNVFVDGANLRIQGSIRSGIGETYKINFYGSTQLDPSGYGEGEIVLGTTNVFTTPLDSARFDATVSKPDPVPDYYTATATHLASGDTSEFSHFAMLDSDHDGMPDGWETLHFGSATNGDPTGHGDDDNQCNLDEFNADTDPTDGESYLRIVDMENVGLMSFLVTGVTFPSSAYRQYRVEHTDATGILTNSWIVGSEGYESGTGTNMIGADALPAGTTDALFRVRGKLP